MNVFIVYLLFIIIQCLLLSGVFLNTVETVYNDTGCNDILVVMT